MPTIEIICQQCDHTFNRVTLNDEVYDGMTCPVCESKNLKLSVQPNRLFKGIDNNSALAKDTN